MTGEHDGINERLPSGYGGRFYGVYTALVTDNQDPDSQGRVKIELPWAPDSAGATYETWARLATMMAGNQRGSWFIPDKNDEVLVMFEAGDPRRPFVVGALWNGVDAPPQSMDADNNKKVLCSRQKIKVTMDDTEGQVTLTIETPGGQKMTYTDTPASVKVEDSNGNSISMDTGGVTISALNGGGPLTVNAGAITVNGTTLSVTAGMSTFSGVVQSDTHMTTTIIAGTYVPGVGNIW